MSKYISALLPLIRRMYKPPSWLHEGERITFDALLEDLEDAICIRAQLFTWEEPREHRCHTAEVKIPGRSLAATFANKGSFVDLVHGTYVELMDLLEPPIPADELMSLSLEAHWGERPEQALDVLCDFLLERGDIKPPRRTIGTRADTRTDAEKATDERADLHKKAKAWARPFVEILFRRNWSTKPWATNPAWLVGHATVTSIDRNAGIIRYSGGDRAPIYIGDQLFSRKNYP